MKKDYDILKTKLIIWDLDETFWNGTLSEGKIVFKPETIELIQELALRGIMNSICSKNDFNSAKDEFINGGFKNVWDLFVFPSINWTSKGKRVQNIIKSMNLRAQNVIFIDDNISNINEVKYYCPEIMSATPQDIEKIAKELYLVNEYDFEYTRLKQYKILEKKAIAHEDVSNEEFLRSSKIKICFKKDCLENIERIKKLILRTNQLNFTKFRDENIEKTIKEGNSAYIIAQDKFGNYGICGFYVLKNNELIHFLFSCRIMNMGIEQFVYNYLNKPKLSIKGEVASDLNKKVDWIEIEQNLNLKEEKKEKKNNINILLKGPCDLYSTLSYIDSDCNIDTEFPYWNKKLVYILAHTHCAFIEQTHRLSSLELKKIQSRFPFPSADEFKTNFFDTKYNIIFLSMLNVTHSGIYINKKDGSYVHFGFASCDITDENNWGKVLEKIPDCAKKQNIMLLKAFKKEYIFGGNPPVDLTIKNLNYIIENLKCKLVLILGSEIHTNKIQNGYEDMASKHKIINEAIRAHFRDKISFIELTNLIENDEDYTTCIDHFSRRVYSKLAKEIIKIANKELKGNYLSLKSC